MSFHKVRTAAAALVVLAVLAAGASAEEKTIRLRLPKRSKPTPVQKLNREGVRAVEKHHYERAKRLFYEAYLLDPNDPFTLNNLGYIAELEGEIERAQRFYALASELPSDAVVDRASAESAEGRRVADVAGRTDDVQMQVNRMNVAAIGLLLQDRVSEADLLLTKALVLDRKNPFTLNNLGYAKEKQGELEAALSHYSAAAVGNSDEPVVVTIHPKWRGKPIREVAAENADKVRKLLRSSEGTETRVARLNLRGVSALNRNDRRQARKYFEEAFKLAPYDAFTLNNMGFVAELDGDRETANYYYRKAQEAERADHRVEVASRREAEGRPVESVADQNNAQIHSRMEAAREAKRRSGAPVVLKRRDNTPVDDRSPASQAPAPSPPGYVAAPPQDEGQKWIPAVPENPTEPVPPATSPNPQDPGEPPSDVVPPAPPQNDVPPPPHAEPPAEPDQQPQPPEQQPEQPESPQPPQ